MHRSYASAGIPFGEQAVNDAAALLQVDRATVLAIAEVETAGFGFLPDRRPQMRFERHIFHRLTGGRFDRCAPAISAARPGGYGCAGPHQYDRLAIASALDEEAALNSASWGLGQIMGINAPLCGYPTAASMVDAFVEDEAAHLLAIARFCVGRGLRQALQVQNWQYFARCYNGPAYRRNAYDTKLKASYARLAESGGPDLSVREQQAYLTYLGHYHGAVDGILGERTRRALCAFAGSRGLAEGDGSADARSVAALRGAYRKLVSGNR